MKLTYYSDDPNLGLKIVTTINGDTEYSINCRRIPDDDGERKYFVIGKDCHLVENKQTGKSQWFRVKSGKIALDSETNEWFIVSQNKDVVKGIIGFDKSRNPTYGYFTPNPYNNCKYFSGPGRIEIVINQDVLIQNNKLEDFSTGIWYDLNALDVKTAQTPRNQLDHTTKGYNIEDNAEEFKLKQLLYANYKPVLSKDVISYAGLLGDTTFGLENECSKGNLPDNIQNRLGIVICRDGSLKDETGKPGPEFVSVPYGGVNLPYGAAKGLQSISSLSKELTKRTTIDINCSLHYHFGNIPTTRVYLVALHRLCVKIQNEIFQMFPYYKANPEGIKNKNYNQKLPTLGIAKGNELMNKEVFEAYINSAYKQMFTWLAEGYMPDKQRNRKNKKHPAQHKWERHERYYWINFMNAFFSNRNTLEFRLHGPTRNAQKMINWLFICNGILKYAMNNSHKILLSSCSVSLNEVMDYYKSHGSRGEFLAEYLKAYIASRKQAFIEDYKKGDKLSKWDYQKDDEYVFTYNGVTNLF